MKNSILFLFCLCSMLLVSCDTQEAHEDYLQGDKVSIAEVRKGSSAFTHCGLSYTIDEDDCIDFTLSSLDCNDCYESPNGPRFLRWEVRDENGNLIDFFSSQSGSYNCQWTHCMLDPGCYELSIYCQKGKSKIAIVQNCWFSFSGTVLGDC